MGQQQLLLIVLGVIIVGAAVAAGISMFNSSSQSSTRDAISNDLNSIAANAQQYFGKPKSYGGGAKKFANYKIPPELKSTDYGDYTLKEAKDDQVTVTAKPKDPDYIWTAEATITRTEVQITFSDIK